MEEKAFSRPLTRKVWSGSIKPDFLLVETTAGPFELPWQDILQINIGRVLSTFNSEDMKEANAGDAALNLVPFLGDYLKNKNRRNIELNNYFAAIIFASGHPNPFRLDSSGTNLRSFLEDEASLAGHINFAKCMEKILKNASSAKLDNSTDAFLKTGRRDFCTFPNLDAFIRFAWNFRESPEVAEKPPPHTISLEEWEKGI